MDKPKPMDSADILKHLIAEEGSFPALKLVWSKHVEVDDMPEYPKLAPSHYVNENNLTTEERHKLLMKQQRKIRYPKTTEVKVEPPIIVFQNYKFGETHKFPISIRNVSRKSQKIVVLMDESYVFKFDECSQRVAKFPCGMCITATITFSPESASEDYFHKVIVSTNTTKVAVPIYAVGIRPLLSAPDTFFLTDSAVRHWTVKPVTVINTGKKTARFTLDVLGPFCVKPDKGVVPPSQSFTFDVAYFSRAVGSHEGEVRIKYDNDEEVFMALKANSINYDIKLSSPDVRCEDTFISLQTRSVIYIENNSNITAKYLWKKLIMSPEKSSSKGCYVMGGGDAEEGETTVDRTGQSDKLGFAEVILFDENGNSEESDQTRDEMFYDESFHVYPLFGEIRPNSKTEIHVVFSPKDSKFYEGVAYLDITGLDRRIPFRLYGRGLGPKFKLGFEVLNVGEVALGGAHTYEVPVQNISEIPGVIQCDGLVGPASGLGMKIEPPYLEVAPNHFSAFYVTFSCTGTVGSFRDEVKFSTRKTGDAFYVTVMGTLKYPSIRFNFQEFNVGHLSLGFPKTYYIPIVNESLNYVQIDLKMDDDGTDPPVDYNTVLKTLKDSHFKFTKNPAEFKLDPTKFTLMPRGMQNIQLTMYPNKIRDINSMVKCFITNSAGRDVETVATIKIRGAVIVPAIHITEEVITVDGCYMQYPCPGEFILKNSSELPVLYCIVPQKNKDSHVKVTSARFIGVLDPWIEIKIPFEVTTTHSGESIAHLDLFGVGCEEKIQTVMLKCESIPSKVEANVKSIDFGRVETLAERTATFELINTSPLTWTFSAAVFQDEISQKGDTWKVEPEIGTVESQTRFTFTARVTLRQVGYHYAGIRVTMEEPQLIQIEVRLKALGVGSPLVFEPPLPKNNILDFGTVFIKHDKCYDYLVTNNGAHPHVLEWKPHGEKAPVNKLEGKGPFAKKVPEPVVEVTTADASKNPKTKPTFLISPTRMVIPSGNSAVMSISAFSVINKQFDESWTLWSYVPVTKAQQLEERVEETPTPKTSVQAVHEGSPTTVSRVSLSAKQKKKKHPLSEPQNLHLRPSVLQELKLHALFEAPGLKFSKRLLTFVIDSTPAQENFLAEEVLKIENVGTLPLKVKFKTKFPFAISTHGEEYPQEEINIFFDTDKIAGLKIVFDGRHLRKEQGMVTFNGKLDASYEGFQKNDTVELSGLVRFPQLELDRTSVDFGQITNGMEAVEQVTVTNPTNFCLTYKWYIKPGSSSVQKNPNPSWTRQLYASRYRPSTTNPMLIFTPAGSLTGKSINPAKSIQPENSTTSATGIFPTQPKTNLLDILGIQPVYREEQSAPQEEFKEFIREKMYRSRMMDFMGLKDAEYEGEDETNYLAYYNQNELTSFGQEEEFNTNELIDVIPLAGLIQAGQSQTFTFVLYGYPDINFSSTLVLYVEGGARKNVEVKGSTVPPPQPRSQSLADTRNPTKK